MDKEDASAELLAGGLALTAIAKAMGSARNPEAWARRMAEKVIIAARWQGDDLDPTHDDDRLF